MKDLNRHIGIDARLFGTAQAAGIGQYTEELIKRVLKYDTDNQFHILVSPEVFSTFPFHKNNLHIHKVPYLHYSWQEQILYPLLLNRIPLNLIHYTNFNAPVWFTKIPSVVTIHDLTLWFFSGSKKRSWLHRAIYKFIITRACRNATKIVAVTEYTKNDIIKYLNINPEKIDVIYEGVPENFKPVKDKKIVDKLKHKFNISKPYLLYVGQFREHKNLIRLIRAFALLRRRHKLDCQLVLGGKPDHQYTQIKNIIRQLNLNDDVVFTGYLPEADLPILYSGAELFVFPSLYEGFGLPPLEAMACGCPVVAADASCLPEVLGTAAEYFNPLDVEDMAKTIFSIANSFSAKHNLRLKGLRRVKKFSFDQMAKSTLGLYQSILN